MRAESDICLFLEGSYPYTAGGVSTWTHNLIHSHSNLSFSLLSIVPPNSKPILKYTLPPNVRELKTIFLQKMPKGHFCTRKYQQVLKAIEEPLKATMLIAGIEEFLEINRIFRKHGEALGSRILLESYPAWELLLSTYDELFREGSFHDFFWSMMVLRGSLFSVMRTPLPPALIYHSLSTGYGGVLLARAKLETQRPCLLTEHGIYTSERKIELSLADWIAHPESQNLSFDATKLTLRDYWMNSFSNFAKICYATTDRVLTLFEGNRQAQIAAGAREDTIRVIPNGIDLEHFATLRAKRQTHPSTVALIGRVVPIKDVRTFIRACDGLRKRIPSFRAFVIGPDDEEPDYAAKCRQLVKSLGLEAVVTFTGRVQVEAFLPEIDVLVLTSLSESQPLVLLEAGAAGIPSVATNVGACREILFGSSSEAPNLGQGGIVVPLANPQAVEEACARLLENKEFHKRCSQTMEQRIRQTYQKQQQHLAYDEVYQEYLGETLPWPGLDLHSRN